MKEAAKYGDFFVTVTGCAGVIDEEDFMEMKEGAILCNAGHFDVEIDMKRLREIAVEQAEMRNNIIGYKLSTGVWIYVLAEGRLVNLSAWGDEIMFWLKGVWLIWLLGTGIRLRLWI